MITVAHTLLNKPKYYITLNNNNNKLKILHEKAKSVKNQNIPSNASYSYE